MPLRTDIPAEHQVEHLMGHAFQRLAPVLQRFHRLSGPVVLSGRVRTEAPRGALARVMGALLGTPLQTTQGPMCFGLAANAKTTHWIRHFPYEVMTSTLRIAGAHLEEHLGPARLRFALEERDGALHLHLVGMRFWGVPCPRALLPHVTAVESGRGDQLHFYVQASLPFGGLVTRYTGHLDMGAAHPEH